MKELSHHGIAMRVHPHFQDKSILNAYINKNSNLYNNALHSRDLGVLRYTHEILALNITPNSNPTGNHKLYQH